MEGQLTGAVEAPERRLATAMRSVAVPPDRVLVVGGGLSGLVTAFELAQRGIEALVLDASARVGGRVRTVSFDDGVTAEAHLEEIWEASPAYPLVRQLGLPTIEHPTYSSAILGGRLHCYQGGGARDLEAFFSPADRDELRRWNRVAGAVLARLAASADSEVDAAWLLSLQRQSFSAFVTSMQLPASVATWIRVTVEVETAIEWHRIAALDGIAEMRPFIADPATPTGERNVAIEGGNERLVDALVAALPEGSVRTGCRVRRVVDHGPIGGAAVHYRDLAGRDHVERGHHVVLAMPVWDLARLDIEPRLDSASQAAMASTRAGSYVKVILRLHPEARNSWARHGDRLFTLLSDGPAGCIYLGDSRRGGGDHILTMLVPGRWARAVTGRSPLGIVAKATAALERLAAVEGPGTEAKRLLPGISRWITAAMVFDAPRAIAYWPHALGRSRFDSLARALRAPHGQVLLGGDTTESSHSDGAVRAAIRVAGVVADRLGAGEVARR